VAEAQNETPPPEPTGFWNEAGAWVSSLNPVPKVQAATESLAGVGPAIVKLGSDAATIMVALTFFTVGMLILLRHQVTPVAKKAAKTAVTAAVPGGKVAAVAGAVT